MKKWYKFLYYECELWLHIHNIKICIDFSSSECVLKLANEKVWLVVLVKIPAHFAQILSFYQPTKIKHENLLHVNSFPLLCLWKIFPWCHTVALLRTDCALSDPTDNGFGVLRLFVGSSCGCWPTAAAGKPPMCSVRASPWGPRREAPSQPLAGRALDDRRRPSTGSRQLAATLPLDACADFPSVRWKIVAPSPTR